MLKNLNLIIPTYSNIETYVHATMTGKLLFLFIFNSADSCVRKRGVRVTGLSKLIFCVVWVIWGLADMVRAGVSSADLSTPFWGVKRGSKRAFLRSKMDNNTFASK